MVGDKAKELIMNKVIEALSDNYLGTQDKKYYFNSKENGETKVVCLAITCPKVVPEFAETVNLPQGDFDWSDAPTPKTAQAKPFEPAEITQKEIDTVKAMLERAGL